MVQKFTISGFQDISTSNCCTACLVGDGRIVALAVKMQSSNNKHQIQVNVFLGMHNAVKWK